MALRNGVPVPQGQDQSSRVNTSMKKNSYDITIAKQKSLSLPNQTKAPSNKPSSTMSGVEVNPRRSTKGGGGGGDHSNPSSKSTSKGGGGRFRFFWKSKDKRRYQNEEDSESLSSSLSSSPRNSPLPPPRSGSLSYNKKNGKCDNSDSLDGGFRSPVCVTNGERDNGNGRLTQSSRDLRERKGNGTLSKFDFFASCKRTPSLRDSLDVLVRKGRKEALKARVEAQREQQREDSSSEDEEQWQRLKRYHSDEALHSTDGNSSRDKRLLNARTERYYKRRTRDDDSDRSLRGSSLGSNVGLISQSRSVSPSPRSWTSPYHQNGRIPSRPSTAPLSIHIGKFPAVSSRQFEDNGETVNGRLPIRKTSVDNTSSSRAPTPPPRSSKYLNVVDNGRNQRPQSYSFESYSIPSKTTMPSKVIGNRGDFEDVSNVPMQQTNGVGGGSRPLSFTASTSVVYNHHTVRNNMNNKIGGYGGGQSLCPPIDGMNAVQNSDSSVYMSDSQMSNNCKTMRRCSVQLDDLRYSSKQVRNRNFNGVSEQWPLHHHQPLTSENLSSMATRPPPSPAKHNDAAPITFNFSTSKGSNQIGQIRPLSLVFDSSNSASSAQSSKLWTTSSKNVSSPPVPPTRKHFRQTQSTDLESIGQRLDKMTRNTNKTANQTDNLENALLELEKIYESMKNEDDEDENNEMDVTKIRKRLENLPSKTSSVAGSRESVVFNEEEDPNRSKEPSKYNERKLLLPSSSMSPSLSIDNLPITKNGPASEPDTVLDDLAFRNIRDANLQKVVEPQPPFGIPLGPISQAAPSDYLHAKVKDLSRPKMRRRFTPDVVQDDLAYRNLRKDKNYVNTAGIGRPNFEELDSIVNTDLLQTAIDRKKYRASRSQSIHGEGQTSGNGSTMAVQDTRKYETSDKSQSLTDLSKMLDEMSMNADEEQKTIETRENVPLVSAKGLGKYKRHSLAANFTGSGINRQLGTDNSGSSTDTLTDHRTPYISRRPIDGDRPVSSDIWQVRVTLGGGTQPQPQEAATISDHHNHPVKIQSKPADSRHLLKPIPIKKTPYGKEPNCGTVLQCETTTNKGLPIDEGQLDDLLDCLARGTALRNNDKEEEDEESFGSVITDCDTGEMSVRLMLPGLKPSSLKAVQSPDENAGDRGKNRVLAQVNSESPVVSPKWSFRYNSSSACPSSNASKVRDKAQMFSSRTQTNVSTTTSGSNVSSVPIGRFSQDRILPVVGTKNSAFDSTVKKVSGNLPERLPTRKMPSNGAQEDTNNGFNGDRIAKYKEERRKQLASKFGNWSSGEDGGGGGAGPLIGEQPSYMRYSRRYKKNPGDSDSSEKFSSVASSKKDRDYVMPKGVTTPVEDHLEQFQRSTEGERNSFRESPTKTSDGITTPVEGGFRTNRASRLRALANGTINSCPSSPTSAEVSRQGSFRNRIQIVGSDQSCLTPASSSSETPIGRIVPDSLLHITTESESGETMSDSTRQRIKDKSSKRKSNLNRMGTVESTPPPSVTESGLDDETRRRHRRSRHLGHETGRSPSQETTVHSDSLKSIEIVRTAQNRLVSSQSPISISETKDSLRNSNDSSSLQEFSKNRSQQRGHFDSDSSDSNFERSGSLRKSGRTTLKRPEIPKIFQRHGATPTADRQTKAVDDIGHRRIFDHDNIGTAAIVSQNSVLPIESGRGTLSKRDKDQGLSETLKELTRLVKDTTAQVDCLTNAALRVESSVTGSHSRVEMGSRSSKEYSVSNSEPSRLYSDDGEEPFNSEVLVSTKVTSDVSHQLDGRLSGNNIRRTASQYDPDGNWQLSRPSLTKSHSVGHADGVVRSGRVVVSYYGGNDYCPKDCLVENLKRIGNSKDVADDWISSPGVRSEAGDVSSISTSSRNRIQHYSRRASGSDCLNLSEVSTLASAVVEGAAASCPFSILKKKSFDEHDAPTRSILKFKEEERLVEGRPPVPHSILKRGSMDDGSRSHSPDRSSILKKLGTSEGGDSDHGCSSPEVLSSILRRRSSEEQSDVVNNERHSILRRKSAAEENCDSPTVSVSRSPEPHSILKKQTSIDMLEMASHAEPRPILKKKFSTEEYECDPKPILKKKSSTEDELEEKPKPILKSRRRSGQEEPLFDNIPSASSSSSSPVPPNSDDCRPFVRMRAFSATIARPQNQDQTSNDNLLPPPPLPPPLNPPTSSSSPLLMSRPPSHSRHTTTSSEDEFMSLPNSPVSWKLSTISALDEGGNLERNSPQPLCKNNLDGLDADSGCSLGSIGRDHPVSPDSLNSAKIKDNVAITRNLGSVFTDVFADVDTRSETNVVDSSKAGVAFKNTVSVSSSSRVVDDLALLNATDGKRLLSLRRRERDPTRYRTQPVTFGELHGTDNFDKVQSFRHLESPKDLVSKYENLNICQSRREGEGSNDDNRKSEEVTIGGVKGEVSSSEDDVIHLSVAAKASLFMQKQSQLKHLPEKHRSVNSRRNLQRSQTQPVTMEELQEAVKIAEDGASNDNVEKNDIAKNDIDTGEVGTGKETSESEEDPSKLSLAERVRLFNQKMVEVRLPTRKNGNDKDCEPMASSRRKRVVSTRFCTQPVTTFEVREASRISPLAASLMRPSESNDLLNGEEALSQSSKTAISLKSSSSVNCIIEKAHHEEENSLASRPRGILKKREQLLQSLTKDFTEKSVTSSNSNSTTKCSTATAAQKSVSCCEMVTKPIVCIGAKTTSSSSSSDDEDETEGITINMRASAAEVVSPTTAVVAAPSISTDDDSASITSGSGGSGREQRRCIKNEAVMRRRNATLRKIEERKDSLELQHSQSLTINSSSTITCKSSTCVSSSSASTVVQKNVKTTQRSNTQPLFGSVMEGEEDGDGVVEEVHGSIRERLAALQKSQDKDWKRRLERIKTVDIVDGDENGCLDTENLRLSGGEESASKILSRVSLLESSQQEWRKRVEEKDAAKFTVAGKLVQAGKVTTPPLSSSPSQENPLLERKKRLPKPVRFQSKTANLVELTKTSVVAPSLPPRVPSILRSKSMPMPQGLKDLDSSEDEQVPEKVSIPKLDDDDFSSFFQSTNMERLQSQKLEVEDAVFNQITSESRQLLIQKRTVQVARRHMASRNPLKALATRSDLQAEYVEVKSGVAEKELRRLKVEQLAKRSDLATSALAGLASTEDFTSVNLRRNSSITSLPFAPYKDLMLLHVKGRRHVQTRLVMPQTSSLNKGDNFILVTPNEVFNWVGEFSNVIERAKGAEIASVIQARKELGCKGYSEVITFEEEKPSGNRCKRRDFFQHLGGEDLITESTISEEDELYEAGIIDTNKVYNVEENELVPYDQYWGCLPRVEMLDPNKVLVFDFGSEMYVWQGKLANTELRRRAIRLARELWEEGYDYTECDVNPFNPLHQQLVLASGKQRPSWALFGKVNQHMETVLFREKFIDWPDMERVIKVRRQDSIRSEGSIDLQPCDAKHMLETKPDEPDLILEGSHLGRGLFYWDEEERRHCDVSSLGIKVWHVLEYNHSILPLESWGQFHSEDTYVVRWQYRVTVAGRSLAGEVSKHSFLGRERCAYFFWQGRDSTINEKGACALMTVELDEERGPHVRVIQGQEPPSFLNLFKGGMTVHLGKRGDCAIVHPAWKMFVVRGDYENEAHLVEIECTATSLRSRGVYVLLHSETGVIRRWIGSKARPHLVEAAQSAVSLLQERKPLEFGFKFGVSVIVKDEAEGQESSEFWNVFGKKNDSPYLSLTLDTNSFDYTPRLFHMTSISGIFSATEISCSFFTRDRSCAFPFLQSDLYKAEQPALFLLDNNHEVYLWQGWWQEGNDENDNTATGSAHLRFNTERKLAMETVQEYCKCKNASSFKSAYAIWAGLEPPEFQNLFPVWKQQENVAELNKKGGKNVGEKKLVEDVLNLLKRNRYTFSELQKRPLPEGVDPSILESYLSSEEFESLLKMTKKEFYAHPSWKQSNLKKAAGLYY